MALPFQPTEKRPGESFADYTDRVLARSREAAAGQEDVAPPSASEPAPSAPVTDDGPAWHKVGRSAGALVNRAIEKIRWAAGRVFNPKVLAMDVKASSGINPPRDWVRHVIADFEAKRQPGDVSVPYFQNFINMALMEEAKKGLGYIFHGMKFLGDLGKQGRENARRIIRWLEENGWIGTFNTLYRDPEDRSLKRGNNIYILFDKETAEEISAVENPSERALKRESITLSRGALLWGLLVRPWGLNATPTASNRHDIRRNPAPA